MNEGGEGETYPRGGPPRILGRLVNDPLQILPLTSMGCGLDPVIQPGATPILRLVQVARGRDVKRETKIDTRHNAVTTIVVCFDMGGPEKSLYHSLWYILINSRHTIHSPMRYLWTLMQNIKGWDLCLKIN